MNFHVSVPIAREGLVAGLFLRRADPRLVSAANFLDTGEALRNVAFHRVHGSVRGRHDMTRLVGAEAGSLVFERAKIRDRRHPVGRDLDRACVHVRDIDERKRAKPDHNGNHDCKEPHQKGADREAEHRMNPHDAATAVVPIRSTIDAAPRRKGR